MKFVVILVLFGALLALVHPADLSQSPQRTFSEGVKEFSGAVKRSLSKDHATGLLTSAGFAILGGPGMLVGSTAFGVLGAGGEIIAAFTPGSPKTIEELPGALLECTLIVGTGVGYVVAAPVLGLGAFGYHFVKGTEEVVQSIVNGRSS